MENLIANFDLSRYFPRYLSISIYYKFWWQRWDRYLATGESMRLKKVDFIRRTVWYLSLKTEKLINTRVRVFSGCVCVKKRIESRKIKRFFIEKKFIN